MEKVTATEFISNCSTMTTDRGTPREAAWFVVKNHIGFTGKRFEERPARPPGLECKSAYSNDSKKVTVVQKGN